MMPILEIALGIDILAGVMGYLTIQELESSRVLNSHWKQLAELDGLWQPHVEKILKIKHCLNEAKVRLLMTPRREVPAFYQSGNCRDALREAYADRMRCTLTTNEIYAITWQLKFRPNAGMRPPLEAEPLMMTFEGPSTEFNPLPATPATAGNETRIEHRTSSQCEAILSSQHPMFGETRMPWEYLTPRQSFDTDQNGGFSDGEGGQGSDRTMLLYRCGGNVEFVERCEAARRKWNVIEESQDTQLCQFTCLRVTNRPPMRVFRHPEHWGVILSHYQTYLCGFTVGLDPQEEADLNRRQNSVRGAPPLTPRAGANSNSRGNVPSGARSVPVDVSRMDPYLETLPKYFHPFLLSS